ncbi:MAG TPA: hypothetical protein DCZ80_00680 [Legionellales bacterium]|nr:hypothetical protein [Legionellales bacterium]
MKHYYLEIVLTLLVKGILLYLLWCFCIKTNSSYWQNSQDWMLNHHFQIQSSPENYFSQPTQGETDDQQHSC